MKTFLDYLTEAKADIDYEKNYSTIDREIFDKIAKMDPKSQIQNDTVQMLGFGCKQLLLAKYLAGETDFIDKGDQIYAALEKYYPNIAQYPKFNEFKSVADFLTFMENPDTANIEKAEIKKENPLDSIYNKYYSNISREDFDKIIALDPQTTEDKLGEIAKNLLLPKFISGEKGFVDNPGRVKEACEFFYTDKNSLPAEKQKITGYDSVESFIKYINEGPESALVASLKANETVDQKTHRPVKDDFRVVASTRDYDILEPKSHDANQAISGGWDNPNGMHWCTGWENNHGYWDSYTSNGKRLFCIMHKTKNRGTANRPINWQLQVLPNNHIGEFLNGSDSRAFEGNTKDDQFENFLKAYPDICRAIVDKEPFSAVPCVQKVFSQLKYEHEPFVLDSADKVYELISNDMSSILDEAIISIDKIPSGIFSGYIKLNKITFKEGVKEIGAQAFKNCITLRTLEFPESLEIIGEEAFAGDLELKGSVKIPNNVREIRTRAFMGDHCKLKIDRARTTPIKFDIVDTNWVKSHVQSIKVQ